MKYYRLNRIEDATGNSGTGHVAEVIVGGPGTAIVLWSEDSNALGVSSIVVYAGGIDDVIAVHGHGGKTRLEEAELTDERREALRARIEIASRKCKEVAWSMGGGAISFSSNFA
jgi:creatinine amidohydrolase/Fe(II)-dependent formamide hydrolase-like protein